MKNLRNLHLLFRILLQHWNLDIYRIYLLLILFCGCFSHSNAIGPYSISARFNDDTEGNYHYIWPEKDGMRKVVKYYQILNNIIPQYGYIDKSGKEVIPCSYLYATDFDNGYAVVGDKIREGEYEYNRLDYWYVEKHGYRSNSSFDIAILPDSCGIVIVGKRDGIYSRYCHPEYFKMHYKFLKTDNLLAANLSDYKEFPYLHVSKFENGVARVSDSWNLYNSNFKDFYIDNSFRISNETPYVIPEFIEENWSDWIYRDIELEPCSLVECQDGKVELYNAITKDRISPITVEYNESPEPLDPNLIKPMYNKGLMGIKGSTHTISCAFDWLDLQYAHTGFIPFYNKKNGKQGLIDLTGKIVMLADRYDKVVPYLEKYIVFKKGNEQGILNVDGSVLYSTKDFNIYNPIMCKNWFVFSHKDPYYKKGIIDLKGNILMPPTYEMIGANMNKLLAVKSNGKWGFIDNSFECMIPCQYDEVTHAFTDYGVAIVKKEGETLVINTKGELETNEALIEQIQNEQSMLVCR